MTVFGNIVRAIKQGAEAVEDYAKDYVTIEKVDSTLKALLPFAPEPIKSYILIMLSVGNAIKAAQGTEDLKVKVAEAIDEQKSMLESEQATA